MPLFNGPYTYTEMSELIQQKAVYVHAPDKSGGHQVQTIQIKT